MADKHSIITAFRTAFTRHLDLLRTASPRGRLACAVLWLLTFALLLGQSVALDLNQQHQEHQQVHSLILSGLQTRLQESEMLQQSVVDIVDQENSLREARIRLLVESLAREQPQLYFIGYQPLVSHAYRREFERMRSQLQGQPYRIRDYQHQQDNAWDQQQAWRLAAKRPRYLPLSMAEPGLASDDWREMGLDLLADSVLAPTVHRAMGQGEAVSPVLRLNNGKQALAFFSAIYNTEAPSPVPLVRSEQTAGMVVQVLALDKLVSLTPNMATRYSVALQRKDSAPSGYDPLIYRHQQQDQPGWLAQWLLPALEIRKSLDTPYLPYELTVRRQLSFDRTAPLELLLSAVFSMVPAYLLLVILALRAQNRQAQEQAQDKLHREREYAMVALSGISDAVISIDIDLSIRYLNPAAETLLGLKARDAAQRKLHQVVRLNYEFARQVEEDPVHKAIQRRETVLLAQNCYLMRSDGEKLLIEGSVSPLPGRDGRLMGAVLTFRDTAPIRRRMLAALEASETRLRQHEMELARVARINTMGEMASGIAHEINQPLSAIMSYCQAGLSLLEDEEPDMAMLRRALDSSVTQASRAGQIIQRLREFVIKKTQQFTPMDLNQVVDNALNLLEYELKTHDIHIEQNICHDLPLVYADNIQLEQVVLNLMRNALDAMETVAPWGRLSIATSLNGRWIRLSIGDNGAGIAPELLDRIFAPFFSTKASGMGLGLAICQTAIEAFGGKLSARNKSTGGAEFIIELPQRDAPPSTG